MGRLLALRSGGLRTSPSSRSPLIKTAGRVAWLMTPVLAAGLGQVAVLRIGLMPGLAVPLDSGMKWRGKAVFGPRKTWRGVIVMTTLSALTTRAQAMALRRIPPLRAICPIDYSQVNPWLLGSTLGLGYCLAELPNSFVKRRFGIPAARSARRLAWLQYLIDQSDSVVGCLAALRLFYKQPWSEAGLEFMVGLGVHVAVDQLMHAIGVKRRDYKPSQVIASALATAGTNRLSRP